MPSPFGPLLAPINIEEAALKTLVEWMPSYLAEVERKNSLPNLTIGRPPDPESYHGGLDWLSMKEDRCPEVIVICNPTGPPERGAEVVVQTFELQVGCLIVSQETTDPEGIARRNASLFSAAAMGAIAQHGSLGLGATITEETLLTASPKVEFFENEDRRFAVAVAVFEVHAQIMEPKEGPQAPKAVEPEEPYPEWPEVKTQEETVKAVPISEPV